MVGNSLLIIELANCQITIFSRPYLAWYQRITGNGIWGIKWSRDLWRHVTPKVLWLQGSTVGYPSDSLASCQRSRGNYTGSVNKVGNMSSAACYRLVRRKSSVMLHHILMGYNSVA